MDKKNKMKLGNPVYKGTMAVDIDGVLADFEGAFCERFGYYNRHLYSLEARHPSQATEIGRFVKDPRTYEDLVPIFGGTLFTQQAYSRGWYVLLVTSRPFSIAMRGATHEWLARYNITHNELIFAKNKKEAISDFDHINASKKVRIVVDDSVSVLRSMSEDKYCVAWSQLWNKEYAPYMFYGHSSMKIWIDDGRETKWIWEKVKNK